MRPNTTRMTIDRKTLHDLCAPDRVSPPFRPFGTYPNPLPGEEIIQNKTVTYDLERQMPGAKKLKCSEFAEAIVENMKG